jgi:hypothetical protein
MYQITQQQCYVYNSPPPPQPPRPIPPRAHSFTTDRIDPQWMYRFVVATVTSADRYSRAPHAARKSTRYHTNTHRIE